MSDSPLYISAGNTSGQSLKDFQLTTDVPSKSDFEYGKRVAQNIYSTIYGNQTYFWLRNNRFRKNRQIANGKIDMIHASTSKGIEILTDFLNRGFYKRHFLGYGRLL